MQQQFEEVFFENLQRKLGFDARSLIADEDKDEIRVLKNHIETAKKVNHNRTRGGEKGRKGFDFELLDENERKNRYLKEGKNRNVEVLDNNDQIIDTKDGRRKLQLKNVSDINSIDFDKYIEGGATIVVPKDKYDEFKEQINKKIERATSQEEKERFKKWKKKLESSQISTFDAEHPNLYLLKEGAKDTLIATKNQYTQRMKSLILSHMLKIFFKKVKEVYNDDTKNYTEAIKEILIETKNFIQEVWAKELGSSFIDVILQVVKDKLLSFFKKGKEIVLMFLNNLEDFISLVKQLITGKITLKEFTRLALKTVVLTLLTMVGIAIETAVAEYISIPFIGEFIGIIISVGIVSFATVFYSEYIEVSLFGLSKIFEDKELLLAQKRSEEIEALINRELPKILEQREKLKIEFNNRLNNLKQRSDESFKRLKDESLGVDEFEKEFEKLGSILGVKL